MIDKTARWCCRFPKIKVLFQDMGVREFWGWEPLEPKRFRREKLTKTKFNNCTNIMDGSYSQWVAIRRQWGATFGPFWLKMKLTFWFLPSQKLSVLSPLRLVSIPNFHPPTCSKLAWQLLKKQIKKKRWVTFIAPLALVCLIMAYLSLYLSLSLSVCLVG